METGSLCCHNGMLFSKVDVTRTISDPTDFETEDGESINI